MSMCAVRRRRPVAEAGGDVTPAQCAYWLALIMVCDPHGVGGTLGAVTLGARIIALWVLAGAAILDLRRARGDR